MIRAMKTFYTSPSPVIPEDPNDPRWPDAREARAAKYGSYYPLFWMLRVINRAQEYAKLDEKRNAARRRKS